MNDTTLCVKRQQIVRLSKDGSLTQIERCSHQAASHFNQNVNPDVCAACPLRMFSTVRPGSYHEYPAMRREYEEPKVLEDGSLVYAPQACSPPAVPDGYRRKSEDLESDDAWVFIPEWPACPGREMANTVLQCGAVKINAMCASKQSDNFGHRVTVAQCEACPVRGLLLEQIHHQ